VLEAGAKKTGRSIDDIDIWWITHREVNSIPGTAQKLVSGMVADNAILLSRFTLNGKFIPEKYKDSIIKLGQSYDLTTHGYSNALTNYAEIAENLGIAQYLVKRFAIAGTPDECISQINTAAQAGARQFMVSLPGPNRPQKLHDWHDLVMTQV
jgi:alkanesulfonate monooxygenase SsuD/methylene tetrahydromethanopterin reductase-like flavin-dependent oxidoreductase (luciferase family)